MLAGCLTVVAGLLAVGPWALAQGPASTELPGKIFFIQKTWVVGGEGNWDYLTLDPQALKLFVAHTTAVQVIDVSAGTVTGAIRGMRDAHGIALDDRGQFGYVTDGAANDVKVFNRASLSVTATVPVCRNPRSIVFEPASQLVFAICPADGQTSQPPRQSRNGQPDAGIESTITVIDAESHKRLEDIMVPGKLGFAQADTRGSVYINVQDRNQIATFNAQDIADRLRRFAESAAHDSHDAAASADRNKDGSKATTHDAAASTPTIDWGVRDQSHQPVASPMHFFNLGSGCTSPRGLAVDGEHLRLFAACDNAKMEVIDTGRGAVVANLPTGPGSDAIAFDPGRGLIFVANGGGLGSLTVIRQNVTDSYSVIQQLPTRQRARTLAVNPANGEVYLVTNLEGFDLNQKGVGGSTHSLPVVQATPVSGSFQVLVIGN